MAKPNPYDKYLGNEDKLQGMVCDYVYAQYKIRPIPLNTEGKKSNFERYKFKKTGGHKGILDLFIPVPRGAYHGLFMELKAEGVKVFKKDGTLAASGKERHQRQIATMKMLRDFGYHAGFAIGFDDAKEIIDNYFKL